MSELDIEKFTDGRVLVVGDLMIDEYLWGDADRISPEAPVPVVAVRSEESALGGSGNVVANLAALGAQVSVAGVIGMGADGDLLIEKFQALGVDAGAVIREEGRPTTRKTRIFAANQHVLRIDRETVHDIDHESFSRLLEAIEQRISSVDIVLVSDYGKGVVTSPLIERLVELARLNGKAVVADPKGLDFSRYAGVTVLTPNKKEAGLAAGTLIRDTAELHRTGEGILKTHSIENLLITCGKDGMVLFEPEAKPLKIPAEARQVYEVSGAGDTVLAVLGLALATGASLREAAALANTAAGIVVGKVGTATVSRDELRAARDPFRHGAALKLKKISDLTALADELRKQGKRIVLTNGCFDLLHAGHIRLFAASREFGDILIVATDDDASVRALKGKGRPVIRADERVRILGALDSVDYVVVFPSEDLEHLIETVRPDVLTKGSNYAETEVAGREVVERCGGRVALVPVAEDISATRIIDSIRKADAGE